jgi:tRNA (cytidine/uridine-2'-O-)-methyltransferase
MWLIETHGETIYTQANYRRGDVLVFGPETRGLPQRLLQLDSKRVLRLPMQADSRSLNQSNVVSVVVFEMLRQLNWGG